MSDERNSKDRINALAEDALDRVNNLIERAPAELDAGLEKVKEDLVKIMNDNHSPGS
jgi:hypothetical protein